jgi:hypothetical protein
MAGIVQAQVVGSGGAIVVALGRHGCLGGFFCGERKAPVVV